jgi:hypothetical protein
MYKFTGWILGLFGATAAVAAPVDLGETSSNQAVMNRLLLLKPGARFEGVRQPNNFVFMRDWEYRRKAALKNGQHVLVFFNGNSEKAVAWVEPGELPIMVPTLPPEVDTNLDRAIDLTGEEYKADEITGDGKIYVLRFKAAEW